DDVDQPLVGPHLELLTRVLILVNRPQDGNHRSLRRQRNRPRYAGTRPLSSIDDLLRRLVQDAVVVRFEPDANFLLGHQCPSLSPILTMDFSAKISRSPMAKGPGVSATFRFIAVHKPTSNII